MYVYIYIALHAGIPGYTVLYLREMTLEKCKSKIKYEVDEK